MLGEKSLAHRTHDAIVRHGGKENLLFGVVMDTVRILLEKFDQDAKITHVYRSSAFQPCVEHFQDGQRIADLNMLIEQSPHKRSRCGRCLLQGLLPFEFGRRGHVLKLSDPGRQGKSGGSMSPQTPCQAHHCGQN